MFTCSVVCSLTGIPGENPEDSDRKYCLRVWSRDVVSYWSWVVLPFRLLPVFAAVLVTIGFCQQTLKPDTTLYYPGSFPLPTRVLDNREYTALYLYRQHTSHPRGKSGTLN
jgi:hypothetical protein